MQKEERESGRGAMVPGDCCPTALGASGVTQQPARAWHAEAQDKRVSNDWLIQR